MARSRRMAEDPLGGRVELDDPAEVVHRDDGIQRRLEDRRLAGREPPDRQVRDPPQRGLARDRVRRRHQQRDRQQRGDRDAAHRPPDARLGLPGPTGQQVLLVPLHLGEHPEHVVVGPLVPAVEDGLHRRVESALAPQGRGLAQRLEPRPEPSRQLAEPGLLPVVVPRQLADADAAAPRPRPPTAPPCAGTTRPPVSR